MTITRPLLRYHGGKYLLAPWIISNFPEHRIYVEPFGGAASVLLRKSRCYAEVYNDLDCEIINLFRTCQAHYEELHRALVLTPFSREEFLLSYEVSENPIEQARRTIIRSFMGFGSASASGRKTGFRSNSNRSGTTPAQDWKNYPDALQAIIDRLRGVVIENKDAIQVSLQHDTPETLHYWDPPYVKDTRHKGQKTHCYNFEMSNEQHQDLLTAGKTLIGKVCISGYDNELYNDLLPGWRKAVKNTHGDGAVKRTEVLWMNYDVKTVKMPDQSQLQLTNHQ